MFHIIIRSEYLTDFFSLTWECIKKAFVNSTWASDVELPAHFNFMLLCLRLTTCFLLRFNNVLFSKCVIFTSLLYTVCRMRSMYLSSSSTIIGYMRTRQMRLIVAPTTTTPTTVRYVVHAQTTHLQPKNVCFTVSKSVWTVTTQPSHHLYRAWPLDTYVTAMCVGVSHILSTSFVHEYGYSGVRICYKKMQLKMCTRLL